MELNALTRWESIGKDLYRAGTVGREIAALKARSKHLEAERADSAQRRDEYEESIESGTTTPLSSRKELTELEREEREVIRKWRSLREVGKRLRVAEDRFEQEVVSVRPDVFPVGHQAWVYLGYRSLRRFAKGFTFGYGGKFFFAFIGLCLRHRLNLSRLVPATLNLLLKADVWRYGAFLGSFLMIFESAIRLLRMKGWLSKKSWVKRHHRSVRVIVAASLASSCAIFFLPRSFRLNIACFFLVRAMEIATRWLVEENEKSYTITQMHPEQLTESKEGRTAGVVAQSEEANEDTTQEINSEAEENKSMMMIINRTIYSHKQQTQSTAASSPLSPEPSPSSSLLLLPPPSLFSRARTSIKSFLVRVAKIPASEHFDTLVMAGASFEVIWSWLFNRSTVDPGYLHFLDIHGGRNKFAQEAYVTLHAAPHSLSPTLLSNLNANRVASGFAALTDSSMSALPLNKLMCEIIHPSQSCTHASGTFFISALKRALPVYLPVYVLPMLLFKHKQLLKAPAAILLPTLINLCRSTLFLASYCSSSWAVACLTTSLGLTHSIKGAIAGLAGGLFVSMEKKGRRIELALYVLSQSLPSTFRTLQQWKLLPASGIPHGDSLCFVLAMTVIMWSYVTRPHLMRSSYLSLFLFFFGSGGRSAGFSSRAVEHAAATAEEYKTKQNEKKEAKQVAMNNLIQPPLNPLAQPLSLISPSDSQHQMSLNAAAAEGVTTAAGALPTSSSSSSSSSLTPSPSSSSPPLRSLTARRPRLSTVHDEEGEEHSDLEE